jgi:cation diffusion facilitator CzcD-associated flavoprotein CzcO
MAEVDSPVRVEECEVAIIGAGIAGMNALFVACQYVKPEQRIILVDSRSRVGGMWVDTYPYVRLHQPYEFFTAGNIPWELDVERSHLASKGEVLDQFEHCMRVLSQKARIDTFFGYTAGEETESDGVVTVPLIGVDNPDDRVEVRAKRLIVATGYNIGPKEPLDLSSKRVRSVSPNDFDMVGEQMRAGTDAVWVIGGGKSGLDTAHSLVSEFPDREVHLVAGSGTVFINRDVAFPRGFSGRWFSGTRATAFLTEVARLFDGTNPERLMEEFANNGAIGVVENPRHHVFGVISEPEVALVRDKLRGIHTDHLVDAVDRGDDVELLFRSGQSTTIPAGSWIVNCTSYLGQTPGPYRPYTSASGAVVRVIPQSATFYLTSFAGYFLTHLAFLEKLTETPLYEIDMNELNKESPEILPWAMYTQVVYNLGLIADAVPVSVLNDCGLSFDGWFPKPRQMVGAMRFLAGRKRARPHQEQVLAAVRERYGVRCGPLEPARV